ncbi:hypothetical protein GCM10029963_05640 [Micromonospora andamanensis]
MRERAAPEYRRCQATVQAAPLRVNEPGLAVLPVWVAWKPIVSDPLGGMLALYETFLAVTCPEVGSRWRSSRR